MLRRQRGGTTLWFWSNEPPASAWSQSVSNRLGKKLKSRSVETKRWLINWEVKGQLMINCQNTDDRDVNISAAENPYKSRIGLKSHSSIHPDRMSCYISWLLQTRLISVVMASCADAATNTGGVLNPVCCTKPPFSHRDRNISYFSKYPLFSLNPSVSRKNSPASVQLPRKLSRRNSTRESPANGVDLK